MFSLRRRRNALKSTGHRPAHVSRRQRGLAPAGVGGSPIEQLEHRYMLTTLFGGGDGITRAGPDHEFLTSNNQVIRIAIRGKVTLEVIGVYAATSDPDPPQRSDRNVVANLVHPPPPGTQNPTPGVDIFMIYITQADMNSSIAIATVPPPAQGNNQPRRMQPFTGSPGDIQAINARTGDLENVTLGGNPGGVYIGSRTGDTIDGTTDEENIPILSEKINQPMGLIPAGKIAPGIFTAPGVSIGQILIGGVVTGRVAINGSCNLFYAGQLLTGDARGIFDNEQPSSKANFFVGGDLRNLVTINSIGTDALDDERLEEMDYKTGVDIKVNGRLGQIMTKDSYLASTLVLNNPAFTGPGTAIQEVEVRAPLPPTESSDTFFQGLSSSGDPRQEAPSLGDSLLFANDTFDTPQYVGTARSSNNSGQIVAEIQGELEGENRNNANDHRDFYAMGLLAGQTAQVKLSSRIQGVFIGTSYNVGVMDPDGRIIASDYSNNDPTAVLNQSFRFTATRPGIYRFVVARAGDINFNGAIDGGESVTTISGPNPYTLLISRVADVGLGAIVATNNIGTTDYLDPTSFTPSFSFSIDLEQGDIGAIVCSAENGTGGGGGGGLDTIFGVNDQFGGSPYTVKHGNLRVMEADSIGILRNNEPTAAPDLKVPRGAVGLLRARSTDTGTATLSVNLSQVTPFSGGFNPALAIGFDYQLVDAGAIFASNLLANRGIGIVRAAQFSTVAFPPRLAVNADNRGNDGFIDLLESSGDFGTLEAGGPEITTGTGGNVRYIRVGGQMFRDRFFGGGTSDFTQLRQNESFRYTDDSGQSVKVSPTPIFPLGSDTSTANALLVQTYGIRDKGGSVLTAVIVPSVIVVDDIEQPMGVLIDTGTGLGSGSAEIGRVQLLGTGSPVTFVTSEVINGVPTSVRRFATDTSAFLPTTITAKGRRPIDIYDIVGNNLNNVENRTSGEIVNITANSMGNLTGQNLGIAKSRTKAEIGGPTVRRDVFPYSDQRTLINISGPIATITARGAIGNVFATGTIGDVTANSDGADDRSQIEGINAPVVSDENILNVKFGEMIMPSGQGDFALSGIFADGNIASIRNQGTVGSDIRGDIVAQLQEAPLPAAPLFNPTGQQIGTLPLVAGIGEIELNNGAIIDSDIMVARWTDSLDLPRAIILPSADIFFPQTIRTIESIDLDGIGGIMGSVIAADSIGEIGIKKGFGVFDSRITTNAAGTFAGIETDGYGLRRAFMDGGSSVDHMVALGTGKKLNTLVYTPSVRQSETQQFDPFNGRPLTEANDLHLFLGTTRNQPVNSDTSVSASIEDTTLTGSRDLGLLSAYRIVGHPGQVFITGVPLMRISFAENIKKIAVTRDIDGLSLTAGTLTMIQAGRNFANTTLEISGVLKNLVAGGNVKASTTVNVLGGEGRIDNFTTGLALFGTVRAATKISRLVVGTDLGSTSVSSSNDITFVHISGSILSGATLRAADAINQLIIDKNIEEGGTVRAKRIFSQTIGGQVEGDIIVG